MTRHETRAVEVGAKELTDGRSSMESMLMDIYGGTGES